MLLQNPKFGPLRKADLQYRYVESLGSILLGDDLTKRGAPDSSLLNRDEWYEVLYFVNWYAIHFDDGRKDAALKAERLIKGSNSLPSSVRSHEHVAQWLKAHWHFVPS